MRALDRARRCREERRASGERASTRQSGAEGIRDNWSVLGVAHGPFFRGRGSTANSDANAYLCADACANCSKNFFDRCSISSLVRSSLCVATVHVYPWGSAKPPHLSPQNWLSSGMVTFPPAATARLNAASQSSTYSQSDAGEPPIAFGPLPPMNGSLSMMRESPIRSSAWAILPSGPRERLISSAPRARLYQSRASDALSSVSWGVTVWNPVGIACCALAITSPLNSTALGPLLIATGRRWQVKSRAEVQDQLIVRA